MLQKCFLQLGNGDTKYKGMFYTHKHGPMTIACEIPSLVEK